MPLTEDQQLVADDPDSNKLVLALPGSGKTHTSMELAANILKGNPNSWLIMVTFTRASTNESMQRLAQVVSPDALKRVRVDTFAKLMKDHASSLSKGKKIVMGPQHEMLIRRAASTFPKKRRGEAASYIRSKLTEDLLKNEGDIDGLKAAGQVYMKTLEQANKIDAATLNVMLVLALKRGEIKPFGATHIIVDEFQDTDATQYEWILAHKEQGTVVTVVGDDDQSIYSWRGARSYENMTRFQEDFEAKGVLLRTCFRCRPEILKAAETLIEYNVERIEKEMISSKPNGGKVEFLPITQGDCYLSDGFKPEELREQFEQVCEFSPALDKFSGRKRRVLESALEELIAKRNKFGKNAANPKTMPIYLNTHGYIAKELSKSPDGWAVLARTNRALDSLQAELAALEVPVIRIGGKSMWDNSNIMGYVSVLAVLAKDTRIDDLDNALFYVGEKSEAIHEIHTIARQNKGFSKVPAASIENEVGEGFEVLSKRLNDPKKSNPKQVNEFLSELIADISNINKELSDKEHIFKMINDIMAGFNGDLSERVDRLLALARKRDKEIDTRKKDTVVLCTLTGSKGLQWPKVWLMDVEHNVLPIKAQEELSPDAEEERIEEERRLAFVAMTRAEEFLRLSWQDGKESLFIEQARGY